LSIYQLLILLFFPIALGIIVLANFFIKNFFTRRNEKSFFISDTEINDKEGDLLNLYPQAENFAERVFNQGSSDSIVFGIDAPWGIGKSSFVNFCLRHWEKKHHEEILVYNFNPLRYENTSNFLEKFIDGLVRAIQKDVFIPEIKPLISKYSRFIKSSKGTISILGCNIEIAPGNYTVDDAFEDLELSLKHFKQKIIIVVDDLDRLSFSAIKEVLFAIKKSFILPNISYVLCYDTENINALEEKKPDTEKITEFLEKFVNVKISLYLDDLTLINYIDNLSAVFQGNSQVDPILVSKAIGGLKDILRSDEYHFYLPFIGDIRKIKKLINTCLLFELEKTDFDNSDFNKQDLINLFLVYINYPNIFRKIYNTETNKKRGFFSVLLPYEDDSTPWSERKDSRKYRNSKGYKDYLKTLTEPQKFILNKIFDVSQRFKGINKNYQSDEIPEIDNIPQEIKTSYACFNGDGGWAGGRNLEAYLDLIVNMTKPQLIDQHKFYVRCKEEVLQGKKIEEVLAQEQFSYSSTENTHKQFWRVVINSAFNFKGSNANKFIKYILDNIQNYSLLTDEKIGIGLRDDMSLFLVELLDKAGWSDEDGNHQNNNEDNISEISEWIFGEGRHSGEGVIYSLTKNEGDAMFLYDLLVFRLFCSADRGGDVFNLQRALSKHWDKKALTEGNTGMIAVEEMREISQKIFAIFEEQYIKTNKNIFEIIDTLSVGDLSGKYLPFLKNKIEAGEIDNIDDRVVALKSKMKSFIIFQLGNSMINHGVGCGYYDPAGSSDKNGIKNKINDYLFNKCFNPKISSKNYEHFIDYLLINFAYAFSAGGIKREYVPSINEFIKVLDKERIIAYWKTNKDDAKKYFLGITKDVFTPSYHASYKDNLNEVYKILDAVVDEADKSVASALPSEITAVQVIDMPSGNN
jgi:hypothetical protein